jgi:DNA modification methylase
MGTATVGVSALRNGRWFAGIDINKKVVENAEIRLESVC